MKDITEFINENLIDEANRSIAAVIVDGYPNDTYIICNAAANSLKLLKRRGITYDVRSLGSGDDFAFVLHSEESVSILGLPNLPQLQKQLWGEYEIDHEYPEFDTLGWGTTDMSDEKEKKNVNDLWKYISKLIEDSEADGDSGYVSIIIDPDRKEPVVAGHTNVHFYDSVQDFIEQTGF